jgi:acyl dehydratase
MAVGGPDFETIAIGDALPERSWTTGFANWNRFAAVNDEFIDIHMDDEAARAVGQPAAFGMGNLRISFAHVVLEDWVGDAGTLVGYDCRFRALNRKGDTLTVRAEVTGKDERHGTRLVHLRVGVVNQDGVDTTPATATVRLWDDGAPTLSGEPDPLQPSGDATPGVHLTREEIDLIGTTSPPVTTWPVTASDIRRWSLATHWPEQPRAELLDETAAAARPWGGMVAPRDFDPFAWHAVRPWGGPWLRGMGTEPGSRVLNGGQRNSYLTPIRPGDIIAGVTRLADVVEWETSLGPTTVFSTEQRWTNQRGELVRVGVMTTLYH